MSDLSIPAHVAAPTAHGAGEDAAAATRCTFDTTALATPDGAVAVLRAVGEVDMANVELLHTALDCALGSRPAVLVVDLVALTFCSVRGLSVLARAGDRAARTGTGYAVAGSSAHLDRVWRTGWTDAERPTGFPTVADAVRSALAHRITARIDPSPAGPAPSAAACPVTGGAPDRGTVDGIVSDREPCPIPG